MASVSVSNPVFRSLDSSSKTWKVSLAANECDVPVLLLVLDREVDPISEEHVTQYEIVLEPIDKNEQLSQHKQRADIKNGEMFTLKTQYGTWRARILTN